MMVFRRLKGRCTCGEVDWHKCSCARYPDFSVKFERAGRQCLRTLRGVRSESEALRLAKAMERAEDDKAKAELWAFLDARRLRNTWATIGQVIGRTLDESIKTMRRNIARRNANDLRRVVAIGEGLMEPDGNLNHMTAAEARALVAKVDGISTAVLTPALVKRYLMARCGGRIDWHEAQEGNVSINATLDHARGCFSRRQMELVLRGLNLPDLDGFLKHPVLPAAAPEPEPIEGDLFAVMVAEAEGLRRAGDLRGVVNLIYRQTGLRAGSMMALHSDWLRRFDDGWMLYVGTVKGGTARYNIPVGDELAAEMLARPGFTLGATEEARRAALKSHTEWLKGVVGAAARGSQAGHRLRDTVAAVLFSWLGREAAVEMLGHADATVNQKHYARLRINVTEPMKLELAAATRLGCVRGAPGNVVPLRAVV